MTLAKHVFVRPRTARAVRGIAGGVLRMTVSFALIAASVAIGPVPLASAATPGYYIAGDGSGGGGGGSEYYYSGSAGGDGGGSADTLAGTTGDDVIFGDGSGGGGGGGWYEEAGRGGAAGGGADTIDAGAGDDIVFGDGFAGTDPGSYFEGADGGFGGGGGGGGGGEIIHGGRGGAGGVLGGGGGASRFETPGSSLYGGMAGGAASKPASGTAPEDEVWGGNSATPTAGGGWFSEQSVGGSAYNSYSGAGGAGFGGENSSVQYISASDTRSANGGVEFGDPGQPGSTTPVRYEDSDGGLWTYVQGQLGNIFTSASGTTNGVGAGADSVDGGAGSDALFGLGGDDVFVFELDDASAADTDTVWDFDRLTEHDTLGLFEDGSLITSSTRDALIASQVASGTDRTLVFSDEGSKTVEIVVKAINRDLTADDFTAVPPLRAVSTGVSSVASTSAVGAGNITADGGFAIAARGVCWGTSANPTTSGSHSTEGTGTGAFTSAITGLSGNTRYHMRAYATNSEETTYGADLAFYFDNGAPSTTASGAASSATTGWSDTTRTVSFSATDTLSGVASTWYAVDGGEPETYTVPVEIGGEDGSHVVAYGSTDASGNAEATKTAYVNIDTAAPATTDDHVASYYGSAIIHLSAVDTLSGPDYTRYTLDSGAAVTGTVVTCSGVGTHTLEYASRDHVGNTEASKTVTFQVAASASVTTRMALNGSSRTKSGRRYSLTTLVSPRSSRYHVHYTIQRWRAGGWSKVRTVTLSMSSGRAVYRFHPYYRGIWRITGVYEGARTPTAVYGSCSATKQFRVY